MATGFLKVDGERVVDAHGKPVILRGAAVGGWMKYDHVCISIGWD